MTDERQKQLFEYLMNSIDEDRQNYQESEIEYIKTEYSKWTRFRKDQVETLFKNNALAKYMKN